MTPMHPLCKEEKNRKKQRAVIISMKLILDQNQAIGRRLSGTASMKETDGAHLALLFCHFVQMVDGQIQST